MQTPLGIRNQLFYYKFLECLVQKINWLASNSKIHWRISLTKEYHHVRISILSLIEIG